MAVKIGVEVDEDDATNTLYTFRDLSSQHLVPIGDVVKTEPSGKNADDEEEEDEGMVYLEFQNPVIKTEEVKDGLGFYFSF